MEGCTFGVYGTGGNGLHKRRACAAALAMSLFFTGLTVAASAQDTRQQAATPPLTRSNAQRTRQGEVTVTGQRAVVDFSMLETLNQDIIGWLYQEETRLSQPVLKCEEDEHYETYSMTGRRLPRNRGCVHQKAGDDPTFGDQVIRLTGDAQAPGPLNLLADYATQTGLTGAPALRLLTPQGDWQAEVFSAFWIGGEDEEVPEAAAELPAWVETLRQRSLIQPAEGAAPAEGEKILLLTQEGRGRKRLLICAALRPIRYETQETIDLCKAELDARETGNGYVTVDGVGTFMVYAQNDPLWDRMCYESSNTRDFRRFGDGGCGPTAVALAVANLVKPEDLPKLRDWAAAPTGTLFCGESVNRNHCNQLHAPYQLVTAQEYLRYLPIAIADFATGNNRCDVLSRRLKVPGTNMNFLKFVCEAYGIDLSFTRRADEAFEWMAEKPGQRMAVTCTIYGGPFTSTSHFMTIAAVDDTYFYLLDPLRRDSYKSLDRYEVVELLAPGVVRVRRDQAYLCNLSPFHLMEVQTQE